MALQGPNKVKTTPVPPTDQPDQYAELMERYVADTTRLTHVVKVLAVGGVTAGVIGYLLGRSDAKQPDPKK